MFGSDDDDRGVLADGEESDLGVDDERRPMSRGAEDFM